MLTIYRKGRKARPIPNLLGPGGITFECLDLVSVFRKILFAVRTEPAPTGSIGWIEDSESDWWGETLQEIFLKVVSCFVIGEIQIPQSHSNITISKDLIAHSNPCTASGYSWPTPAKYLNDYTSYASAVTRPRLLDAHSDSTILAFNHDESAEEGMGGNSAEPRQEYTPDCDSLNAFQQQGLEFEKSLEDSFMERHRRAVAENDVLSNRPVLHPELEFWVSQPAANFEPSTWYSTELSNLYARSNIWAKSQIHLRVLDEEKQRLDSLNYDIQMRICAIEAETLETTKKAKEIEMRLSVLQGLYSRHIENINALKAANTKLRTAEARQTTPSKSPVQQRRPGSQHRNLTPPADKLLGRARNPYSLAKAQPQAGVRTSLAQGSYSQTPCPTLESPINPQCFTSDIQNERKLL